MPFLKLITLSLMLTLLASCGDLFSKKVKESESDQFATCELDTEALSKIMTEKVQGDLNCLGANLKFFIEIVKTDRPGYLSKRKLIEYINSNMDEVDQVTMDALAGVFDVNTLLFGDDLGYIKKSNVDKLINLFKDFNRLMVDNKIYYYFTADEGMSFYEHNRRKSIIYSTFSKLSAIFSAAVVENDKKIQTADVIATFKHMGNQEIIEHFPKMLFLKKAILGGSKEDLSSAELARLIDIVADAAKIAFDFINLPDTRADESQDEEILKILKEDLLSVYNALHYKNQPDEPIVDYENLEYITKKFFPSFAPYLKYKNSFLKIKEVFLGSNSEVFSSEEITRLVYDLGYMNASKGVFFYNAYAYNRAQLDDDAVITNDFENLQPLVTNSSEEVFIRQFNRIAKSSSNTGDISTKGYKYIHGTDYIPLFSYEHKRNPRGMFEIAIYEYLVKQFFAYYGSEDSNAVGDYTISLEQLENLMRDFGDFFVGEGYIFPGKEVGTAETLTLMSTLFHHSSNGDARVEINEFVELIITLTSSLTLGTDMQNELRDQCGDDKLQSIHPACYRLGFKKFVGNKTDKTNGLSREAYMPGLMNYLNSLSAEEFDSYIRATAKFSRTCTHFDDGTEVPMTKGDFIVSWAGLLAVEQSIFRYDANKSGILEFQEAEIAYEIYKPAIEAMIPVDFLKRFSRAFFQYIVKYERVPDVPEVKGLRSFWKAVKEGSHFLQFAIRPKRFKRASADRMTFAKVLQIIGENSPSALENPFDCELLRTDETQAVQEGFSNTSFSTLFGFTSMDPAELKKKTSPLKIC